MRSNTMIPMPIKKTHWDKMVKKAKLENQKYWDSLPDREPDFKRGVESFWFNEMMLYNSHTNKPYPLRYDNKGDILDFFDHEGDMNWIDRGDDATEAYKSWVVEQIILRDEDQHVF